MKKWFITLGVVMFAGIISVNAVQKTAVFHDGPDPRGAIKYTAFLDGPDPRGAIKYTAFLDGPDPRGSIFNSLDS